MALTLIAQQESPLETFTHAIWTVESDDPSIRKVRGVFTGRLNDNGVITQISLEVQPSFAGTAIFDFDLQEFFRDQVTYDIQDPATPTDAVAALNSWYSLLVYNLTELINDNGQLVEGASLNDVTNSIVVNAARQTYNPAGLDGYIMDVSVSGFEKFLTNSPRTIDISTLESYVLSVYSNSISIVRININFRNASGGSLGTQNIIYTTPKTGRYDIPIGPANLIAKGISIPNGTYDYVVRLGENPSGFQSEPFVFRIVKPCRGIRIHFLNRWGGFDSYTFNGNNSKQARPSSSQYEKYLQPRFTPSDRGKQYQYRDVSTQWTLNSGIVSDEEALWLEELIGTPVAYMEVNNELIPILIADGEFTTEGEGLKEFTVTAILANNVRNQRL